MGQRVERADFVALLDGKLLNPASGEVQDLARNSKGADRRAGWDFTISAPKSVSIVGLLGADERVLQAHRHANAVAMAWLEQHGAQIRIKDGQGRNVKVATGNLVYATVTHETSRDNEPQIHNHNVIVAATYDLARDTWRSLTNDALFTLRADADVVYKAALARELRLAGYQLTYAADGVNFEIKGLEARQLEAFSSRSLAMDAALKARGLEPQEASWSARQAAALDTRASKRELPRAVLQTVWQQSARSAGLDVVPLVEQARARAAAPGHAQGLQEQETRTALRAVSWAVEHLSAREQSYPLAALEKTAIEFGQVDLQAVQQAIRSHLQNALLVVRDGQQDGQVIMTTWKAITAERQLQANLRAGMGSGKPVLQQEADFQAALQAFERQQSVERGQDYRLSGEQVQAARNMLMHPDAYQAIQGDAGTGKTAALAFVRQVAQSRGWQVRGVAVSASAAQELQASSGIESQTLARMFAERETAARQLQLDIAELRAQLAATPAAMPESPEAQRGGPGAAARSRPATPRTEVRRLQARSADIDFGPQHYTFAHAKGEVFRGPGGLQEKMAVYLGGLSLRLQAGAAPPKGARSLGARLRMQMAQQLAKGAGGLGESLMRYQKVGTVEAIAARNALYQLSLDAQERLQARLSSKQAELFNLRTRGNSAGANTLLVMDESSMGGIHDMVKYTALANDMGARVVIQGDEKQHGSVAAGRAFAQLKRSGVKLSTLEQTRRFTHASDPTRNAVASLKQGRHGQAMLALDTRQVSEQDLATVVAARFIQNYQELQQRGIALPRVGVVTLTNKDRKSINTSVQSALRDKGLVAQQRHAKPHLDDPKLTPAEQRTVAMLARAGVNRLVFRKDYQEIGVGRGEVLVVTGLDITANRVQVRNSAGQEVQVNPDWHDYFSPAIAEQRDYSAGDRVEARAIVRTEGHEIKNGTRGSVVAVDAQSTRIQWDHGLATTVDNAQIRFVDLAYAHTSYKEQGATNDREIMALSKVGAKVFNRMAAYVSATRARDNTEIVTSDLASLVKNADKLSIKTVATEVADTGLAASPPDRQENLALALGRILAEQHSGQEQGAFAGAERVPQRSDAREQTRQNGPAPQRDLERGG